MSHPPPSISRHRVTCLSLKNASAPWGQTVARWPLITISRVSYIQYLLACQKSQRSNPYNMIKSGLTWRRVFRRRHLGRRVTAVTCLRWPTVVGHRQETLVSVDTGGEVPLHSITNKSRVTNRLSEDTVVNSRGRQLLQLMTNHDLLIVNGRVCGDMRGRYTCCQWNGSSVVDMLLIHTKWNPVPNQLFQCRWYWVVYWSCGLYICRPHSRYS